MSASAGRLQFARAYRPTWSLVLGIALTPVIIGIPLLLVKSTETWGASVDQNHRRVEVRVTGKVLPAVLLQLQSSLSAGPTPIAAGTSAQPPDVVEMVRPAYTPVEVAPAAVLPPPTTSLELKPLPIGVKAPPLASPPADDGTPPAATSVHRDSRTANGTPIQEVDAVDLTILRPPSREYPANVGPTDTRVPSPIVARFDTGQVQEVAGVLLVGRDPEPLGPEPNAILLKIDDPELSVSKTHLSIKCDGEMVVVCDLGSTNGTSVADAEGGLSAIIPHVPVTVVEGTRVVFGNRSFRIARGNDSAAGV